MCWVERGVRNQREVVTVWGRWGRGFVLFCLVKMSPIRIPRISAARGLSAPRGEIGFSEMGGSIIQFSTAPQIIAARERRIVGPENKILSL